MMFDRIRSALVLGLLIYAVVGYTVHVAGTGPEDLYPFFSWSLFARVPPATQSSYELWVTSVEGNPIMPVLLESRPDLVALDAADKSPVHGLTQDIGRGIENKQQASVDAYAQKLATYIHRASGLEIRKVEYDAIEHFRSGAVLKSTAIGQFIVR